MSDTVNRIFVIFAILGTLFGGYQVADDLFYSNDTLVTDNYTIFATITESSAGTRIGYQDGTFEINSHGQNYQRYDGEWENRNKLGAVGSEHSRYLIEEQANKYIITTVQGVSDLPKVNGRAYTFEHWRIAFSETKGRAAFVLPNTPANENAYVNIPYITGMQWDNKQPRIKNESGVYMNAPNVDFVTVNGIRTARPNQSVMDFGFASDTVTFEFNSWYVVGDGGSEFSGNVSYNGTLLLSDNTIVLDDPIFDANTTVLWNGSESQTYYTYYNVDFHESTSDNDVVKIQLNATDIPGYVEYKTANISAKNMDFNSSDYNYIQMRIKHESSIGDVIVPRIFFSNETVENSGGWLYNIGTSYVTHITSNLENDKGFLYYIRTRYQNDELVNESFFVDWIIATNDSTLRTGEYRESGNLTQNIFDSGAGNEIKQIGWNGTKKDGVTNVNLYFNGSTDNFATSTGYTEIQMNSTSGEMFDVPSGYRYCKPRDNLNTTNTSLTPEIENIRILCGSAAPPVGAPDTKFEYYNGTEWAEGEALDYLYFDCFWWTKDYTDGVFPNAEQSMGQPTLRITNNGTASGIPKMYLNTTPPSNIRIFIDNDSTFDGNSIELTNISQAVHSSLSNTSNVTLWAWINLTGADDWDFELYANVTDV